MDVNLGGVYNVGGDFLVEETVLAFGMQTVGCF